MFEIVSIIHFLFFLSLELVIPSFLMLAVNVLSAGAALYGLAFQALSVLSLLALALYAILEECILGCVRALVVFIPVLVLRSQSLVVSLIDLACQCVSEYTTSTFDTMYQHFSAVYDTASDPTVRFIAGALLEVLITVLEDAYTFHVNFGVLETPTSQGLGLGNLSGSTLRSVVPEQEVPARKSFRDVEAKALALLREKPTLVRPEVFRYDFSIKKSGLNPLAPAFSPKAVRSRAIGSDKLRLDPLARPFTPVNSGTIIEAKPRLNPLAANFKPVVSVKSNLTASAKAFVPVSKPILQAPVKALAPVSLNATAPIFVPKSLSIQSQALVIAKSGLNATAPAFVPTFSAASTLNANAPAFTPLSSSLTAAPASSLNPAAKAFVPAAERRTPASVALPASPSFGPRFVTSGSFNLFPLPTTPTTLTRSASYSSLASVPSPMLSVSPTCPAYTMGAWDSDTATDSEGSSFTLVDWEDEYVESKEAAWAWDMSYGAEKAALITTSARVLEIL